MVVLRSFLRVFMLQGFLLQLLAVPIIYVNSALTVPLGWLTCKTLPGCGVTTCFAALASKWLR